MFSQATSNLTYRELLMNGDVLLEVFGIGFVRSKEEDFKVESARIEGALLLRQGSRRVAGVDARVVATVLTNS